MLIIKASGLDRSQQGEVQEFNRLLDTYKTALFGETIETAVTKKQISDGLSNTFKQVQNTFVKDEAIDKLRVGDTVNTDIEIPMTDIKTFAKNIAEK